MGTPIQDYQVAVDVLFTEIGTAVDGIAASMVGIEGDVQRLKAKIIQLETNPGPISPEDQAILTSSVATVSALATKVAAANAALKALDDATAPDEVPTPPGT